MSEVFKSKINRMGILAGRTDSIRDKLFVLGGRSLMKELHQGILGRMKNARAKENYLSFLKTIEEVRDAEEDTQSNYRNDSSDGVPCVDSADLAEVQQRKLDKLLKHNEQLFPPEEPDAVESVGIGPSDDINQTGKWGYTRLHFAVVNMELAEVKELLSKGASLDIKDNSGHTPLDKAERIYNMNDPTCREIYDLLQGTTVGTK